jgi:hypothetical protein
VQALARGHRQAPARLAQLGEHGRVVGGVHEHGREGVVLGGGPDHRGAADVDVLDDLRVGGVAARDRGLEGVEVHAHEVHWLDPLLNRRLQMRLVVAHREQSGVEPRVQGLHAPVHHLGEACEVLDRAHRHARVGESARGAAGRDDLDA